MKTTFIFMRGVEAGMNGSGFRNPYEHPEAKAEWSRGYRLGSEYLFMKSGGGVIKELEIREVMR